MKMSEWFESGIRLHGDIIECDDFAYAEMSCEYVVDGVDAGVAICHAVNNHDRMADEIAELRKALLIARNGYKNLIELGALPNNGWNGQAKDLIGMCDKALTKHK